MLKKAIRINLKKYKGVIMDIDAKELFLRYSNVTLVKKYLIY